MQQIFAFYSLLFPKICYNVSINFRKEQFAVEHLTKSQQKIYDFIKQEIRRTGTPPSIREIMSATEFHSTSSVHHHLNSLERKGYIERPRAKNRCIRILEDGFYNIEDEDADLALNGSELVQVPIIGTVSAGTPILAVENIEGYFPVPVDYLRNNDTFMLRIRGNSMINVGIFNNDLVLVNQQDVAENNDIVIALLDDSATCKRYFRETDHIRLQPENDDYEPIIVRNVKILGKVIGLFRSF
jgi:repressor LexA